MVIMYGVMKSNLSVTKVEADRVTDKSIFVNGVRRAIASEWSIYFDTIDAACEFAIRKLEARIESSTRAIEDSKSRLAEIKSTQEMK